MRYYISHIAYVRLSIAPAQNFDAHPINCNLGTVNPSQMALQVADLYLAEEIKKAQSSVATAAEVKKIDLTEARMKEIAGFYRNPANGEAARVTFRNGKLFLDRFGPAAEIAPHAADRLAKNWMRPML